MKLHTLALVALWWSALLLAWCSNSSASTNTAWTETAVDAQKNSRPQRMADINGTVKEVIGNEFTIETIDTASNPLLSQPMDREKMQTMSDTERQAFFEQMQEARTKAKRINISVTIPVGIPVFVRQGWARWWFGWGMMWMGGRPWWAWNWWGLAGSLWGWSNTSNTQRNRTWSGAMMWTGKQWTITDIKEWYQIQVWVMTWWSEDRKIAERVSVTQQSSNPQDWQGWNRQWWQQGWGWIPPR